MLFWLEKALLLLDYVQFLALLWAFGRPWPWPQLWLDRYRWLTWANIDLPSVFSGDYADTAPTERGSVYGTLPAYWVVALVWAAVVVAAAAVLFITQQARRLRPFNMPSWHPAAAQVVLVGSRVLYIPCLMALLRMYPCETHPLYADVASGPSRLAVDPEVSCGSAGHILLMLLFVGPTVAAGVGIPLGLAWVARSGLVYAEPHRHERYLRWKDAEQALGLDQSDDGWMRWVAASFVRGSGHPYRHAAWTATAGALLLVYTFARHSPALQAGLLFLALFGWGVYMLLSPGYRCASTGLAARGVGLSLAMQAFWGLLRAFNTVTYFTVDTSLLASLENFNLAVAIFLGAVFVSAAAFPGSGWHRGYVGPHLWAHVAAVAAAGAEEASAPSSSSSSTDEAGFETLPPVTVAVVDNTTLAADEAAALVALPLDPVEAATLAALLPAAAKRAQAARAFGAPPSPAVALLAAVTSALPCARWGRKWAASVYSPVPAAEQQQRRHWQSEETAGEALQRRFGVIPGRLLHGLAAACRLRPALSQGWTAANALGRAASSTGAALVKRRDPRVLAAALRARQLLQEVLAAQASSSASASPEDARHALISRARAELWGGAAPSSALTDDYLSVLDLSAMEYVWVVLIKAYRADEAHLRAKPAAVVDLPRLHEWAALLGEEHQRACRARHVLEWSLEDAVAAVRVFIAQVTPGNVMVDAYCRLHMPMLQARLALREQQLVFMKAKRRHILTKLLAVRCFVGERCKGLAARASSAYQDISPEEVEASSLSVASLREVFDVAVLPAVAAEVAPGARRRDEGDPNKASADTSALLSALRAKVARLREQRLAEAAAARQARASFPAHDPAAAAAVTLSDYAAQELEIFEINALLRRASWLEATYCCSLAQ